MIKRSFVGMLLGSAISLLATGCGSDDKTEAVSETASIKAFEASAESIGEGERVTLVWETARATSLILSAGGVAVDLGDEEVRAGSVVLQPTVSTDYRLSAYGKNGKAVSRSLSVEVLPAGPPTIEHFGPSSETVARLEPFTLSWQTKGATSVRIVSEGQDLDLDAGVRAAAGEVDVSLRNSATFVLIAAGPGGEAREETRVTVAALPEVSLSSDVDVVDGGERVQLTWSFERATEVVIRHESGEVVTTSNEPQGTVEAQVDGTTVFVAEATGPGGQATDSVRVEARPVIVSLQAQAFDSQRPGALAQVSWETRGAEELILSNGGGFHQVIPTQDIEQGSLSAPIATGGGFVLEARSGTRAVQRAVIVETTELPLVRRFEAGQLVTAGSGQVGVSTVEWEIDGASRIRLEVDPGGVVDLTDKSPRADRADVSFIGAGTLTLTAYNAAGEVQVQIDSPVDPVPTFPVFFAAPSRAGGGERVDIHWETESAASIILEMNGEDQHVDPTLVNGSFTTQALAMDATFRLRAVNSLGFEATSNFLEVLVGAPNILSLRTDDDRFRYPVGSTVNLLWENDGGTSLTITDQSTGQVVCSTSDALEIRRGGCSIALPMVQEMKTFVMAVANGSGTDSQSINVQAVTGPIIEEFTTDVGEITEGGTLFFSWVVSPDADGNIPSLALADNHGNTYSLDGLSEEEVLEGTAFFEIPMWAANPGPIPGDYGYTFTLTATSENPPEFSLSHDVTVWAIPVVDDMTADPPFAESEGDPVQFSWNTSHGALLELFLLDRDGEIDGAAVFSTTTKAEVDAGSTSITPMIATPNVRVVVTNPVGRATETDFRIGVNPATVTSFTANGVQAPAVIDVLFGEDVTIEWETLRSTEALYGEGFVDLSQRPNAVELPLDGTDTSTTLIERLDFPAGFTFPFDGEEFDFVRIAGSGYLTFDPTQSATGGNVNLPSTTASHKTRDLFPFWDSLNKRPEDGIPAGTLWWEHVEGDLDHVIIQWTNMNMSLTAARTGNLNFQAVLFEDGTFEYRYGVMAGEGDYNKGRSATIAAQNREGTEATVISYNTIQPSGFEGKVFRFNSWDDWNEAASTALETPLSGNITFTPMMSRSYFLTAQNGHSDHTEEIEIRVHPKGALEVWTTPAEPLPGEAVTLHWAGNNLTSLEIEDSAGNVIHTATPAELASGSIGMGVLAQGIHWLTFFAEGMVAWNQIEQDFAISVNDSFSLDSFTVSDSLIKRGDAITVSWATTNATSATITELPSGVVEAIPASDLASGSMQFTPQVTSTYVLEVESHERYRNAEEQVEVRSVWIDDFSASATTIGGGGTVTLSWDTTADGKVSLEPELGLNEVASGFEDILPYNPTLFIGPNETSGVTRVDFPAGFTFPFYEDEKDAIMVSADGWAGFDYGNTSSWATNQQLPASSSSYHRVNLPIFWDALDTGATGRVDGMLLSNPTRYVIQWSNVHRTAPSSNRNWDLNFQIVLFPDGSFEYHYGTMAPPPGGATSTSDCNPLSCEDEAAGSSASIGFQNENGTEGFQLQYGGNSSANDPPFPGGLASRSFRYDASLPNGVASIQVTPDETTTYTLCIEDDDWQECREVLIEVVLPGVVQITEVMPAPASGSPTWVEVRNLLSEPVDLGGWSLESTAGSSLIAGPLVIPAGGYAVLASDDATNLGADYIYGPLPINPTSDTLGLTLGGSAVTSVTWDSSWNVTAGQSLELDPIHQKPGISERDQLAQFCLPTDSYDGSSFGTPGQHGHGCSPAGLAYRVDTASTAPLFDISSTGTVLFTTFQADATANLSFSFPFFDDASNVIGVTATGFVALQSVSYDSTNDPLPTSGLPGSAGMIAPYWEYFSYSRLGASAAWEERTVGGVKVAIFHWTNSSHWDGSSSDAIDYQLQLWENGDIVFGYLNLRGDSGFAEGKSTTIGLQEAGTSPRYLQYSYNEEAITEGQVIYFEKLP